MESPDKKSRVGFLTATSLVVGNMIGSGIFLTPAALAIYGGISIYGWLIGGAGAILLALVFSRLSKIVPASGGPYVYTKMGFGEFAGFLVAWGYWISIICTNAAIAVTLVGYLAVFLPAVISSPLVSGLTAIGAIWILTFVNTRGVAAGGRMQLITTYLKVIPLLMVALVGIFYLDPGNFQPLNISSLSNFDAILAAVALTFFSFQGLESATIPSEDIANPEKVIPRATMTGTVLVILIYTLSYITLVGLIPPAELQQSTSPFADGAAKFWGSPGRYLIGLGAIVSTFGALNGWILLQGQIPYAVSRDRLFPEFFSKLNSKQVPALGLIVSSILVTLLVATSYTRGLVGMFKFMILLTTVVVVFPYFFSSMSEILIRLKQNKGVHNYWRPLIIGLLAFIYLMWVLTGAGTNEVFYGLMLILSGIPLFVWIKLKRRKEYSK